MKSFLTEFNRVCVCDYDPQSQPLSLKFIVKHVYSKMFIKSIFEGNVSLTRS